LKKIEDDQARLGAGAPGPQNKEIGRPFGPQHDGLAVEDQARHW